MRGWGHGWRLGVQAFTYVGVRRGDRAAQAGVRRRRHLVVHVVPVAHVVAGAGACLDVPPQFQFHLPRRLHERVEAGGRAPRRARASARCECGPGPGAGRTCAAPPAAPSPARRAPPYKAAVSAARRRRRSPGSGSGPRTLRPVSSEPRRARPLAWWRA